MTDLAPAPAQAPPVSSSAAALAARIPIPTRLPDRHDGQPLSHLSASSYARWLGCPDSWRRYYICGERPAPSGAMFLGSRVDDVLSAYYQRRLDTGERLALSQLLELYRERWLAAREEEKQKQGIQWEEDLSERRAFGLGAQAIQLALERFVPKLGDPVSVQRRLEFSVAPGLDWTVLCYLDLETTVERGEREPAAVVVDFKVKGSLIYPDQADRDPQAGLYLAGRWLEGRPARELAFAQIAKPGKRRANMTTALVATTRSEGQLRGILARIALAASQIAACYERFGPDLPWGFADPSSWRCTQRFCPAWAVCPGGAGL